MLNEEDGPGEAAIGFADQFVDAGRAKLDAVFGPGYAERNPQALAAYLAACASNLNSFMLAATQITQDAALEDALFGGLDIEADLAAVAASRPARSKRGPKRR